MNDCRIVMVFDNKERETGRKRQPNVGANSSALCCHKVDRTEIDFRGAGSKRRAN